MAKIFTYSLKLLEVKDYRDFLATAIAERKARQSQFSYQSLVNRAGLKSKGFPLEVIQGKKRLSLKSAKALAFALNLDKNWEDLFLTLLFLDEAKERPPGITEDQLRKSLDKIKNILYSKNTKSAQNRDSKFPAPLHFPEVYASLGSHQTGASRAEILKRSALQPDYVDKTLEWISKNGFAEFDSETDRYLPKVPALFFEKLGKDLFFKEVFRMRLLETQKIASNEFNDPKHLFLSSVFSVREKDLPQLTDELKETMSRYIVHSENPNGDRLARLLVALF